MTQFVRVYTGLDGQSHLEDIELDLEGSALGGGLSAQWQSKGVQLRTISDDFDFDFHVAPRRQFVVNLIGSCEVEVTSGDTRIMGPGSILLAEDTTGRGHKTRKTNGGPLHCLLVHLS